MNGKVYLFNVNAEEMTRVQVRTWPADDPILGWSEETDSKYAPNAIPIGREKFPVDSCAFAQGDNSVSFSRATYNGSFMVTINPDISLFDDLICFVTRSSALLMRTNGEVISETAFNPTLFAPEET